MTDSRVNPFEEHYIAKGRAARCGAAATDGMEAQVVFSPTLDADLSKWERDGYSCVGLADTVSRAGEQGVSRRLQEQAARVGAVAVLFCVWPAKVRSVRREANGEIDLDAVVADPPASFSPKSYAVTRALFLGRTEAARAWPEP